MGYEAAGGVPIFAGVELVVEDEAGLVGLGLECGVEGIDLVVGIAVDDADEGGRAGEVAPQHHVVVDFAGLALDVDLEDAFQLEVPALEPVLGCVGGGVLNMRISASKKGYT